MELLSSDTPRSEPASTDRSTFDQDQNAFDERQDDIEHFFGEPADKPSTDLRKTKSRKLSNQSQKHHHDASANNYQKPAEPLKPKGRTRNALLGSQHLTSKTKQSRKNSDQDFSSNRHSSSDDNSSSNNLNITNDTDEKCGTYRLDTDPNNMINNQNELNLDNDSNVDDVDFSEQIERYEPPPELLKRNRNQYTDNNKFKGYGEKEDAMERKNNNLKDQKQDEKTRRWRAAFAIQTWWRRVRIRQTAGAAAIKRMMEQKQVMLKERLSMERETVSLNLTLHKFTIFFSFFKRLFNYIPCKSINFRAPCRTKIEG